MEGGNNLKIETFHLITNEYNLFVCNIYAYLKKNFLSQLPIDDNLHFIGRGF